MNGISLSQWNLAEKFVLEVNEDTSFSESKNDEERMDKHEIKVTYAWEGN